MAQNPESTKNVVLNPRAEIDTSPPFESVKEAVDRFGGSGPWIPHHLLRLAVVHHDDADMEEQAEKLERDLTIKEQETLNVLKELESTRRFVEDLKLNMAPPPPPDHEMSSFMAVELNQAKLNLNKTSVSLAVIQASIDSLNQKLRRDKDLLQNRKQLPLPSSHLTLPADRRTEHGEEKLKLELMDRTGYEAEQFKKMTEASRYEVMKAMAEIEQTKNSIKMAEMRLNAAKKMEEAAKAVEAIAIAAQTNSQDSSSAAAAADDPSQNSNGITLSLEEYRALTQKAKQADELELELCSKTKFIDQLETPVMEKFEEKESRSWSGSNEAKFKFRSSQRESPPTRSIGDVLSRKFIVQDDVMVGRQVENRSERQHVSLSQMLRKQSRVVLNNNPSKATRDDGSNTNTNNNNNVNVEKQHYFFQRKKIGFIQVPIPTKKKTQPTSLTNPNPNPNQR